VEVQLRVAADEQLQLLGLEEVEGVAAADLREGRRGRRGRPTKARMEGDVSRGLGCSGATESDREGSKEREAWWVGLGTLVNPRAKASYCGATEVTNVCCTYSRTYSRRLTAVTATWPPPGTRSTVRTAP